MSARVTVSHHEDSPEIRTIGLAQPLIPEGVYVDAEITYRPEQTAAALAAVDRLAAELRRQIADATERKPHE